ncbi:MAG: hypothetical protein NDJ72_12185, partial [Elusimicrobia bacterium]|nr:hypothetical protein [Elusimicrobiota bacterium]
MKKRLLKDTWFQMFAAIGGVACVVSILGGPSVRRAAPAAPAAVAAAAPAAKSAAAPAAAQAPSPASALDEVITPAPASS